MPLTAATASGVPLLMGAAFGRMDWNALRIPVSCLAVIKGAGLRIVWNRHAQRVLGTVAGLGTGLTVSDADVVGPPGLEPGTKGL